MTVAEILKLMESMAALYGSVLPLIQKAGETLSSDDQAKIREAAEELHRHNKALTESTVARLRG